MNILAPIHLGSPGEDISKKDLHKVVQRFILLNQSRLQRIQSFLLPRQNIFLDLLPLLFNQNHPLLPGFISLETVAGIPNYTPSRHAILQAKSFSKHFTYKRRALREYPIQGIYLMGSVSSLAFAKNSDIDIWLCHSHDLRLSEIDELQAKASAIEKWAKSLDLEVHIFLINSKAFIQGKKSPISSESSGQTQHYLLLEEFYRTALYIAGRPPVWWIVPPHEEHRYNDYVQHLKEKRFIADHEMIDFGSLENIPAEEFVSATLWHLYKSLDSPYKSLLKLLLMECYASEYPAPAWLCLETKKTIYQGGHISIDDIDPYVLIYHKIERYLSQANDPERLNFARQCFYLKIMGDMEKNADPQKLAYREAIITQMEKRYQWPEKLAASFVKNKTWNIKKASLENDIIIRQLKLCYRMISRFSNNNAYSIKNQDIQLIGRKLKSFLQKRPGKIDIITTRSNIYNKENELSLIESELTSTRPSWCLYPGIIPENNPKGITPFKQNAHSLVELLSWLVVNRLYQQKLQLHIQSTRQSLTPSDINNTLSTLNTFFLEHNLDNLTALPAFKQANRIIANLLLINLGHKSPTHRKDGMLLISDRSDVLSYGSKRENFVQTIDQISISSWGEVTTQHYLGVEGLFDCFIASFNLHSQTTTPLKIECYTAIRGKSIALGIEQLFNKLVQLYSQQDMTNSPRLIVAGESAFYLFQKKDVYLHYWKVNNLESLILELAKPQVIFSVAHFNASVLNTTPLPFLFSLCKENTIQVFYYQRDKDVNLYIIDEQGSLFSQRHSNTPSPQLLTAYSNFLETLYDKGVLDTTLISIEYNELHYSTRDKYSVRRITPPRTLVWNYLNICITGEIYGSPPEIWYTLYCNELEFSATETGEDVFKLVANYIYDIRQSKEKYPIYITEIDVPIQALGVDNYEQLQSIHFLCYKQKLESRLNTH